MRQIVGDILRHRENRRKVRLRVGVWAQRYRQKRWAEYADSCPFGPIVRTVLFIWAHVSKLSVRFRPMLYPHSAHSLPEQGQSRQSWPRSGPVEPLWSLSRPLRSRYLRLLITHLHSHYKPPVFSPSLLYSHYIVLSFYISTTTFVTLSDFLFFKSH